MAEQPHDPSDTRKHIKQLENQNIKFQKLLGVALEITKQDVNGIAKLKEESKALEETVRSLEREKETLENELQAVLNEGGCSIMQTVRRLETEHRDLEGKFQQVLHQISKENNELQDLKAEDEQLKKLLANLELEKSKLLEEIRQVEKTGKNLSATSVQLHEKLSEIEKKRSNVEKYLLNEGVKKPTSNETILENFSLLEKTYRTYIKALQEHTDLAETLSDLDTTKLETTDTEEEIDVSTFKSQTDINAVIIQSNTNILNNIQNVKSKLSGLTIKENISDILKGMGCPEKQEELEEKSSQTELVKDQMYEELETSLVTSTHEISLISDNILDPELKRLVHEIEIQKALLLINLRTIKAREQELSVVPTNFTLITEIFPEIPSISNVVDSSENLNEPLPEANYQTGVELSSNHKEVSSPKQSHKELEERLSKLEYERETLLEQLNSVSSPILGGDDAMDEHMLQSQTELHSTFMRERSSEGMPIVQNFDDATNQLYADEDARLEQRIRELEIENARIKAELQVILEEIKGDRSSQLQNAGQQNVKAKII